jgi:hypothetical protein
MDVTLLEPISLPGVLGMSTAIVDNGPIMDAVLHRRLAMPPSPRLRVTLTGGVRGTLLSRGWAIARGFAASVLVHRALDAPRLANAVAR